MAKENTDKKFVLRISDELKQKLEKRAAESNRSLNGHILSLIKQDAEPISITVKDLQTVISRNKGRL